MKRTSLSTLLSAIAIVAVVGLTLLLPGLYDLKVVSLILCAVLIIGWIAFGAFLIRRRLREKTQAEQFARHIEALCLFNKLPAFPENVPPLPSDHPLKSLAEQVEKSILDHHRRVQELEHARTAQEVRCFRAISHAEQIKKIFEGLTDPILAVDDYDELVLANESAEKLLNFEIEKTETRALKNIIHCEKLINLLSTVRQRKNVGMRSEDIEIAAEDGKSHWYRATACKLAGNKDEAADKTSVAEGAIAVLRDISEQKTLQKRNAEFVSSVSHEMKTPLAGIKAYVELLADGDAEDEKTTEEFLNVIALQADRLQRLVENMLNIARIEAGVVSVSKQQRPLNEILEEALRVVQPSAEAKNIELVSQLSSMYLGVLADRDMLLQAAINLLSNAIKYTRNGGTVTLRSRLVGEEVCFEVQDTGVGLSTEDCQKVFEKFYRVRKDKDMAQGTGLGLPLTKHIIEDVHGGQLTVESALGVGSTFLVTLPGAGQLKTAT